MDIRRITQENALDLNLPNEPFEMPGRFIPELKDGCWSWRAERFEKIQTMTFPEEHYDFQAMEADSVLFGAYEEDTCIGLAIFQKPFYRYMYLLDLKVSASARRKGVGMALIRAGLEEAKKQGYVGIYCLAQDNNLNACRFYLKAGFEIGGFDNRVYKGTSQEGKADVMFYLDA